MNVPNYITNNKMERALKEQSAGAYYKDKPKPPVSGVTL